RDTDDDREIQASHDGRTVRIHNKSHPSKSVTISLDSFEYGPDPQNRHTLPSPRSHPLGVTIENTGEDELHPVVNGQYVFSSYGYTLGEIAFYPGSTDWFFFSGSVYAYSSKDGYRSFLFESEFGLESLTISGDGTFFITLSSYDIIEWYHIINGRQVEKVLTMRIIDDNEWIAWTDDGYYTSSANGDGKVGWIVNSGIDTRSDYYSARQFERIFYRPDYVRAVVKHHGDVEKARAEVGGEFFDIADLRSIAPARIEIKAPGSVMANTVKVDIQVDKRSLPMTDIAAYVNGIPTTPTRHRILSGADRERFSKTVTLPLNAKNNEVRIEVFNGTSMGVATRQIDRKGVIRKPKKGDLYLLSIGVNAFPNMPEADLEYAAKDAEVLATTFKKKERGLFRRVHVKTLSDGSRTQPTRKNILAALDFIKPATGNDTVILFLASHGLSDKAGNYYFVPRDARYADIQGLFKGVAHAPSLISWEVVSKRYDIRQAKGCYL
ncbi:MAG: caspase family protein, partial [Magnetococcales bacterium]|nr:caspase family protein [Magnetococcales bacterium]